MRTQLLKVLIAMSLLTGFVGAAPACGSDDDPAAVNGPAAEGGASSTSSGGGLDGGTAATNFDAGAPVVVDGKCGFQGLGTPLHVADGIDLCLPKTICASETCPPPLGDCVDGKCVFKPGYKGVETLPEAWATRYCNLASEGCHGVTQIDFPEVTASSIAKTLGIPICQANPSAPNCVGIAASSPMLVGNSQVTTDPATGQPVTPWGLGLTEASGICYEVTGPGGKATVAFTDRCGGYCKCKGSGFQECGPA